VQTSFGVSTSDAFVAECQRLGLRGSGPPIWAVSDADIGQAIAIDSNDNVYVTGIDRVDQLRDHFRVVTDHRGVAVATAFVSKLSSNGHDAVLLNLPGRQRRGYGLWYWRGFERQRLCGRCHGLSNFPTNNPLQASSGVARMPS